MTKRIYTTTQLSTIDKKKGVPLHIAFVPDGNRRWARKHLSSIIQGHRQGADTLMNTVRAAKELGIKTVTSYTFSTENWSRPTLEVRAFFQLLKSYLKEKTDEMIENGVRLHTIGDPTKLPKGLRTTLEEVQNATAHCTDIDLVLAINYGARDELRRAIHAIVEDGISKEKITEKTIATYLDTAKWGDPDLMIRTSGEYRMSNFLLWQMSYSEVYLVDILWPDFTPLHLLEAVQNFQKRTRRWGGGN